MHLVRWINGKVLPSGQRSFEQAIRSASGEVFLHRRDHARLTDKCQITLTYGKFRGFHALMLEPATTVSFLGLPAELRNKIYGHVLAEPEPIRISASRGTHLKRKRSENGLTNWSVQCARRAETEEEDIPIVAANARKNRLALTLVNKQVSRECRPILYQVNTFAFDSTQTLSRFLDSGEEDFVPRELTHITLPSPVAWAPDQDFGWLLIGDHFKSLTINSECVFQHAMTTDGRVNLADLIEEFKDPLQQWHESHKRESGRSGVLDLVRLCEFDVCEKCGWSNKDVHPCEHTPLSRPRGPEHQKKISAEFRKVVAKELCIRICGVCPAELGGEDAPECRCTDEE